MNYLAHLWLAPRERHAMIGNLMGDFRRHLNGMSLPGAVMRGIETHQRVDRFTDSHPEVQRLKTCFSRKRRRYAGIILDVAFDHFLAVHWDSYATEPRREFIDYSYACLHGGMELMPARMQRVVGYMIGEDWLGSYRELSGVATALDRLSRRMRFENHLHGAAAEVERHYQAIDAGFSRFFPDLVHHVNAPGQQAGGVIAGRL